MKSPARTILITGAGSGLGRGLALWLAQQGHAIVATDLDCEAAQQTAAQVAAAGGTARAHALNVTSEEQIAGFVHALGESPIDVLVNNAGLQSIATVEEYPAEKWDLLMDVLLKGPFLMSRALLPGMRARGYGRLVHIGSIHSHIGSPYKSAYTAAKHALLGFSKVLALETSDADITSNTVCPAYIRTPLVDAQIADQARAHGISEQEVIDRIMLAPMPKKTFITIDEVAAAIDFLASPLARNITGQTITIDGGWIAA